MCDLAYTTRHPRLCQSRCVSCQTVRAYGPIKTLLNKDAWLVRTFQVGRNKSSPCKIKSLLNSIANQ